MKIIKITKERKEELKAYLLRVLAACNNKVFYNVLKYNPSSHKTQFLVGDGRQGVQDISKTVGIVLGNAVCEHSGAVRCGYSSDALDRLGEVLFNDFNAINYQAL